MKEEKPLISIGNPFIQSIVLSLKNMKKIFLLLVMLPVFFAATPKTVCAQTGHLFGHYLITDVNYQSGDYYDVYGRIQTIDGYQSNPVNLGHVTVANSYTAFPSNTIPNVYYSPPVEKDYYSVLIAVRKNGGSFYYNTSLLQFTVIPGTPPIINFYSDYFNDPIEVKIQ
jgi:hypothetical protein